METSLKYFILLLTLFASCTYTDSNLQENPIDISHYQVQSGFELEVIAAEPLIEAPVEMLFDPAGRTWVVEMKGYMTDFAGSEEKLPNGQISILLDKNKNGRMDSKIVFLDSLVLPRAIQYYNGGLLYATPPHLWWVPINEDLTPGEKQLVDEEYATSGNVEHQPNGLMYHLDNWLYNAKSNKRYRMIDGQWKSEYIFLRGQWGITQDAYGHLFTNDNSRQFKGDYFLPGILDRNKNLATPPGINVSIVKDQRVYPLHGTAVNRGYMDGVLDPETKKLIHFTSACGPLYYDANAYDGQLSGQGFACAPEANLIKRNRLTYTEFDISGTQYYEDKEFIVTDDETFRPVNLKTGPDGLIYIVDMHRGLIQHKTYLTSYLRGQYEERQLDTLINSGRILRITGQNKKHQQNPNLLKASSQELINLLSHENQWYRHTAQQLLISRQDPTISDKLKSILSQSENPIECLHSFWTLEGLQKLESKDLETVLTRMDTIFVGHVVKVLYNHPALLTSALQQKLYNLWQSTDHYKNKLYLTSFFKEISNSSQPMEELITFFNQLSEEEQEYAIFFMLANVENEEHSVLNPLINGINSPSTKEKLEKLSQRIESNIDYYARVAQNTGKTDSGLEIFESNCSTCHGRDGKGIEHVAPPFYHSEFLEGRDTSLVLIALHGLKGPITVNGKLYEFPSVMPGLGENTEYSDREIASVLSYIKNAFGRKPKPSIKPDFVKSMREHAPENGEVYTAESLKDKLKTLK